MCKLIISQIHSPLVATQTTHQNVKQFKVESPQMNTVSLSS